MSKSTSNPFVSVVIPTYNRARLICEAIDSVLAQTYDNFEIIVVDDGSIDDTKMVLNSRYGNRIRYIYQCNNGPSGARNRGVEKARHELIAFLDTDDLWLPDKLKLQVPLMSEPGVILSYTNWIGGGIAPNQDYFSSIGLNFGSGRILIDYPLRILARPNGSGIWTVTCICRKEAIGRVGCFDERMRIAEDIRLWFRLAFEGKFAITSKLLAKRRWVHSGEQLTQQKSPIYLRESAKLRLEVFLESYARSVDSPPDIQRMLRRFVSLCFIDQAEAYALEGKYAMARRKALESLAFSPKGKTACKAFIGLIFPSAFRIANRKYINP